MERQSVLQEFKSGKNMQYLIDKTADRFRPLWWPNFFSWADVPTITYETVIGDSANPSAASVVAYDSAAPLRTRRHIKKLSGEIPSIREKFQMGEKEMQDYRIMSAGLGSDAQSILNLIFADVQSAAQAPHKRLDIFALEALSTGQIVLDTDNNPDGIITESAIDFGMAADHKTTVEVVWSAADKSTVLPITDIMAVVNQATDEGIILEKMFMRRATFNLLRLADETVSYVTGYKIGTGVAKINITLQAVNEFLLAEGLPKIVLVDASIDVEKDGVPTAYNPFAVNQVAFVPAGSMGQMLNAPIMEKLYPAKHVTYSTYNRVLLKKWSDTDPIREFTACELNAFPSWKNVDKCFVMDTATAT